MNVGLENYQSLHHFSRPRKMKVEELTEQRLQLIVQGLGKGRGMEIFWQKALESN